MDSSIELEISSSGEEEDNSVYNSAVVPDVMWKIREDCEKLMSSYNETADGGNLFCHYSNPIITRLIGLFVYRTFLPAHF